MDLGMVDGKGKSGMTIFEEGEKDPGADRGEVYEGGGACKGEQGSSGRKVQSCRGRSRLPFRNLSRRSMGAQDRGKPPSPLPR